MTEQENTETHQQNANKTVFKLVLFVPIMFMFALFVMPPLYDAFCEITGLNGKTGGRYVAEPVKAGVDKTRTIKVQFLANNNKDMPWAFKPLVREIKVHPGASNEVSFWVRNPMKDSIVAQAIPSVTPFEAAEYFHKTECFCFTNQQLAGGEEMEMPLVFIVDQELPEHLTTITLSYTLFNVTDMAANQTNKVLN